MYTETDWTNQRSLLPFSSLSQIWTIFKLALKNHSSYFLLLSPVSMNQVRLLTTVCYGLANDSDQDVRTCLLSGTVCEFILIANSTTAPLCQSTFLSKNELSVISDLSVFHSRGVKIKQIYDFKKHHLISLFTSQTSQLLCNNITMLLLCICCSFGNFMWFILQRLIQLWYTQQWAMTMSVMGKQNKGAQVQLLFIFGQSQASCWRCFQPS